MTLQELEVELAALERRVERLRAKHPRSIEIRDTIDKCEDKIQELTLELHKIVTK